MAFVYNGILFIGVHIVGVSPKGIIRDRDEWGERLQDNLEFVLDQLEEHKYVNTMVIIGHAKPKRQHNKFFKPLYKALEGYDLKVLYVHGDGHEFSLQYGVEGLDVVDVEVDQGKNAPPLKVTVRSDGDGDDGDGTYMPFQFARYY